MAAELLIKIKNGTIKGTTGTNLDGEEIFKFLGIPFAKPPIGDLRFKDPQPAESWNGVLECTKDSKVCPTLSSVNSSEDCLYLNVFKKSTTNNSAALKPVMVFIHGGAFTFGSGTQQMCGPEYLLIEDIIFVACNYRLGIFGFLSSDDSSLEVPGNAGLKDQTMALKWVHDNIQYFGGDSNNVTLFGVSAGAASVQFQLLSQKSTGLFQRAIIQSGNVLSPWCWGCKNILKLAQNLDSNISSEKKALEKLRSISDQELSKLGVSYFPDELLDHTVKRPFGPVIEAPNSNAFIQEEPIELLKNGKFYDIPLLEGVCSNEGLIHDYTKVFGGLFNLEKGLKLLPWFIKVNNEKYWEDLLEREYFQSGYTKENIYDYESDVHFVVGTFLSLKMKLKHAKSSIYFYVFNYETDLAKAGKKNLKIENTKGAPHGFDLSHLFPTMWGENSPPTLTETDKIAIRKFIHLWTNFARGEKFDAQWAPISNYDNITYCLIEAKDLKYLKKPFEKRLKLWHRLFEEANLTFV